MTDATITGRLRRPPEWQHFMPRESSRPYLPLFRRREHVFCAEIGKFLREVDYSDIERRILAFGQFDAMKYNHDTACELHLAPDDRGTGGLRLDGGPTCYCAERQRLHILDCDEHHAHGAPHCCVDYCWCRPGMNFYPETKAP